MLTLKTGNIIKADAEALVNTVNCVGIMGKGIALQFKKAFPETYFNHYQKACRNNELAPSKIHVWKTDSFLNPKYIINFPTKRHWKEKSKYEYIESGLKSLVSEIKRLGIRSIAIPPLGSGLGGLEWRKVREMIDTAFSELPEVETLVYEPKGAPAAREMPVRVAKPKMTLARALFIKLMQYYSRHAYRLTLLEIQKLAYFLQESGVNLRLNYVKHLYGPYAHNLNKVLEIMEGHYIRGYGDTQKPDMEITLLPDASTQADAYLDQHENVRVQLEKVNRLVDGFETPYGMELLASVHWILKHQKVQDIVEAMNKWSIRKRNLFKADHIKVAYKHLKDEGWINP
jgi:O-acetyl-ADP-ribose deacetylase (regulator of RNase III)